MAKTQALWRWPITTIVPGKKFFTWGVGNKWDKILTDDDGPYLEIMVGAYSDNQPDYSWFTTAMKNGLLSSTLFPSRVLAV